MISKPRLATRAMPSEEDELSLRRWRDLLRTELTITLEKPSQSSKDCANKRLQHYLQSCAEQYWIIITRITVMIGKRTAERISSDSNDQRTGTVSSIWTIGERLGQSSSSLKF
jgi:hypothetical protein